MNHSSTHTQSIAIASYMFKNHKKYQFWPSPTKGLSFFSMAHVCLCSHAVSYSHTAMFSFHIYTHYKPNNNTSIIIKVSWAEPFAKTKIWQSRSLFLAFCVWRGQEKRKMGEEQEEEEYLMPWWCLHVAPVSKYSYHVSYGYSDCNWKRFGPQPKLHGYGRNNLYTVMMNNRYSCETVESPRLWKPTGSLTVYSSILNCVLPLSSAVLLVLCSVVALWVSKAAGKLILPWDIYTQEVAGKFILSWDIYTHEVAG